jgi:Protein of unknown function (DUF3047)
MNTGVVALIAALGLGAVWGPARADGPNLLGALAGERAEPNAPWRVIGLPKQTKPLTQFRIVTRDGARVLEIEADMSYGNLVHDLPGTSDASHLSWRWRIERGNTAGDPHKRSGDDHVLAVCALFDLPLTALPFVDRQIVRAARAVSGQDLPSATLCYTWDERQASGVVLDSPFTHRVRYLVLRGQGDPLREWRREERDLRADFRRLFGTEASTMPPLLAVAVAGDADNTQGHSIALLADLVLQ